jgi:deoxyadenosine/deoxycytidine kinase
MNDRPRIIEIVGLAGTGKSTLVKSLRKRNEKIQIFPLPKSWFLWSLTKRSILWLPLWFRRRHLSGEFTSEEVTSIGCLDAWLDYLQLRTSSGENIAIMDPGSVYWLTKLQGFTTQTTGRLLYRHWFEAKFEQWSSALDVIIWLDAPEELCLQRVLARDQWHDVKDMAVNEALGRFRVLRKSYQKIVAQMASQHPKKVFHFHTDQISTEQMVEQIVSEVNLAPRFPTQTNATDRSKNTSDSSTQTSVNNSTVRTGY